MPLKGNGTSDTRMSASDMKTHHPRICFCCYHTSSWI